MIETTRTRTRRWRLIVAGQCKQIARFIDGRRSLNDDGARDARRATQRGKIIRAEHAVKRLEIG